MRKLLFELADYPFFQTRNIRLTYSQQICDLLLCVLLIAEKSESKGHYKPFSVAETLDRRQQNILFVLLFYPHADAVRVAAEHIRQQQFIAVPINIQWLVDRHFEFH